MTIIHGISANFLQAYVTFQSKEKLTIDEMFKRLSLEMGGDGKTITKKQLDKYLEKIDSGKIEASREKTFALKQIQKHWDEISDGEDSITVDDLGDYSTLLAMAMTATFESEEIEVKKKTKSAYDLLLENLGISDLNEATNSELGSYLKTLLADESDDETIANAIDSIINIMADMQNAPTISAEA